MAIISMDNSLARSEIGINTKWAKLNRSISINNLLAKSEASVEVKWAKLNRTNKYRWLTC